MKTRIIVLNASKHFKPVRLSRLHDLSPTSTSRSKSTQANPIGEYYTSLLEVSSTTPTIASKPPTTATRSSSPPVATSVAPNPSILFSSRLSSPLERHSEIQRKSRLVAGVLVPPRPAEPDDCCMSGCVNCVWDRYRDEVEEWAAKRKEADEALGRERGWEEGRKRRRGGVGMPLAISMDDDGGGSEGNWDAGGGSAEDELFKGVPVGIREFMRQEKRLKEKRAREEAMG